jgi:hypothetical protein
MVSLAPPALEPGLAHAFHQAEAETAREPQVAADRPRANVHLTRDLRYRQPERPRFQHPANLQAPLQRC